MALQDRDEPQNRVLSCRTGATSQSPSGQRWMHALPSLQKRRLTHSAWKRAATVCTAGRRRLEGTVANHLISILASTGSSPSQHQRAELHAADRGQTQPWQASPHSLPSAAAGGGGGGGCCAARLTTLPSPRAPRELTPQPIDPLLAGCISLRREGFGIYMVLEEPPDFFFF